MGCLDCFACGAELGSHKSNHRYIFANNAFSIFPKPTRQNEQEQENSGRRRASIIVKEVEEEPEPWTVLEDTRLLDAVEMYSYGNWKEIAKHIHQERAGLQGEIRQVLHQRRGRQVHLGGGQESSGH